MSSGKITDPVFVIGEVVNFEGQPCRESWEVPLHSPDTLNVRIQLIEAHPPRIEVVAKHRGVVGKPNLG